MNSEELNDYYNKINKFIDEYIDTWKVNPTNLKKYLYNNKSKLKNFLEKRGLTDIKNIDIVIKDVIEHREALHKDSIMKFESFKIFENFKISELDQCIYQNVGKSNINHEKILCDLFDTNLSQVDVINSDIHLFKVNSISDSETGKEYIIYLNEELETIKSNIIEYLINKVKNDSYKIDLGDFNTEIPINSIISESKLMSEIEKIIDFKSVMNIMSYILKSKIVFDNINGDPIYVGSLK